MPFCTNKCISSESTTHISQRRVYLITAQQRHKHFLPIPLITHIPSLIQHTQSSSDVPLAGHILQFFRDVWSPPPACSESAPWSPGSGGREGTWKTSLGKRPDYTPAPPQLSPFNPALTREKKTRPLFTVSKMWPNCILNVPIQDVTCALSVLVLNLLFSEDVNKPQERKWHSFHDFLLENNIVRAEQHTN